MSEEIKKNSQSPTKLKEEETNIHSNKIMTEQVTNKSKGFLFSSKLSKEYIEEDEIDGMSIFYKDKGPKIKLMSIDLLLKKIIFDNFIEKYPIEIYSFCQQCFCFMDKELMFNKIYDCYKFYKEKNTPIFKMGNLIKFLNILVIEMYEYYTKMKLDDPAVVLLKNIYNTIFYEICEKINNEAQKKAEQEEENLNINDFQNKLEDFNAEEDEEQNNEIFKDRCSEYTNENNKERNSRERFVTIAGKKNDDRFSSYENNIMARNTINIAYKENEDKGKKKKKGFGFHFFGMKKEKPVKVEDKNAKEEQEKDDIQEKFRQIQLMRKSTSPSPEEEIVNCVRTIIILFSMEEPKKRDLASAKRNIDFYKDINYKIGDFIGKPLPDKKTHQLAKSLTVENVNKKNKLKLHENDGFFDVLDWDKKEIGEKLISISKNLINKVQRREIYKAVFLKDKKEITSPNVMENIDKFNKLTFFIIQDILSYDFAKDRVKIMEKWIKIADYCMERKDYNDCVAINSALNNYIITGLSKTNNELSKDKKERLKKISKFCRYQGNYKKLREDMKSLQTTDFYIPYLGMILKDLAFFEENAKYIVNGVLINFEKLENVQKAVCEFFNFKNNTDKETFQIPEELNFFEKLEDLKEADLEQLANKLEPEFKLYDNKKREKRQTNIDKKYFGDTTVKRPNMRDSKRLSHK